MTEHANVAIAYNPDDFHTNQPLLVGRHAAGESFFKGFCQHTEYADYYCYARNYEAFHDFSKVVRQGSSSNRKCHWISLEKTESLSVPGCLFNSDPRLDYFSWHRQHYQTHHYSLCGIIHTLVEKNILQAITNLVTAPIEPWDALICTSKAGQSVVNNLLEGYSDYLQQRFQHLAIIPRLQLPIIPLGINSAAFKPTVKKREQAHQIKQQLNINEHDIVILYFGRLSHLDKAHPLPICIALEKLAQETSQRLFLLFTGAFPLPQIEQQFKTMLSQICPSVHCCFLNGRNADVAASVWYCADIFTSLADNIQETFGLTPIEAMASGLPVVVSDWDGYQESIRHDIDGFRIPTWLPPAQCGVDLALRYDMDLDGYGRYCGEISQCTVVDVEHTYQAFKTLVENPTLRKQMGENGQQRVQQQYDWSVIIPQYQHLWQELAAIRKAAKTQQFKPMLPNPKLPDPFQTYRHYSSRTLSGDTHIEPGCFFQQPGLDQITQLEINNPSRDIFAEQPDCDLILSLIKENPACQVRQILTHFGVEKHARIIRTLCWYSKLDVLKLR